jgi:hypothetical protein
VTTPLSPNGFLRSVTIEAGGNILVGGVTGGSGTSDLLAARYSTSGSLDTTFGANGFATGGPFAGGIDEGGTVLAPDGRIVVVSGHYGWDLARFLAAGPQISSFTTSPNPVTAGSSLTLTASNITDANPGATITQVAFYLDSNGDGSLDAGDALVGYGIQTSPGVWTFTFSTSGLSSGTYTLFAQAEDSYGVLGDPLATTAQVM